MADPERPEPGAASTWCYIVPDRPLTADQREAVAQFAARHGARRRYVLDYPPSGDAVYLSSNNPDVLQFASASLTKQLDELFEGRVAFREGTLGHGPIPIRKGDVPPEAWNPSLPFEEWDPVSPLCPSCERVLVRTQVPCPDDQPGCLVLHEKVRCEICGWPRADASEQTTRGGDDDLGLGNVVITYWPDDEDDEMARVLEEEAGLSSASARAQMDQVRRGGMIYLEFPTVEKAKQVATAAARLGALAEFGAVSR
jgi:hypothetical protein